MKKQLVFGFGALFLLAAVCLLGWRLGTGGKAGDAGAEKSAVAPPVQREARQAGRSPAVPQVEAADGGVVLPDPETAGQDVTEAELIERIGDLATTYEDSQARPIAAYLRHPSAEVREAALDALLVLGSEAASPYLREAARLTADPREAVKMLEAAEYLELPSGYIPRSQRRGAAPPADGDAGSNG